MKPRLLLADDHVLVMEGLRKLLEDEFELIGAADDGATVVEQARRLSPDAVLLDISMPKLNGFEAARQIKETNDQIKIVFLTMHASAAYLREAFRSGGCAYVLKRSASAELSAAVRTVLDGGTYVSPFLRQGMDPLPALEPSQGLTARQLDVLRLIAEGKTAKEVAAALKVSVRTAEFHKSAIMAKLGIRTTAQLTRYALENGVVV